MKIPVKFQYISIVFRKNLINFTLDSGCRKAIRVGANKIKRNVKIQEKPFGTYSINYEKAIISFTRLDLHHVWYVSKRF